MPNENKAPEPKWGYDQNMQDAQIEHYYCPQGWKVEEWIRDTAPLRLDYHCVRSNPKGSE
jgi:hypothetical protein